MLVSFFFFLITESQRGIEVGGQGEAQEEEATHGCNCALGDLRC